MFLKPTAMFPVCQFMDYTTTESLIFSLTPVNIRSGIGSLVEVDKFQIELIVT